MNVRPRQSQDEKTLLGCACIFRRATPRIEEEITPGKKRHHGKLAYMKNPGG